MTHPDPRTQSAIETYGFDPATIGTHHIKWWVNARGNLCVRARDYPFVLQDDGTPTLSDHDAILHPNYVNQYQQSGPSDPCLLYVFIPLDQVKPEQEE